jgi:hypothetical protein
VQNHVEVEEKEESASVNARMSSRRRRRKVLSRIAVESSSGVTADTAAEINSPDDGGQQLTLASPLVRPRHDSNHY